MSDPTTVPLTITFRLAAEAPFTESLDVLLTIANDRDISQRLTLQTPEINLTLPLHDGPGDAYRLVASVHGYHDCGGFIHVEPNTHRTVSLLLIPKHVQWHFPTWADLQIRFAATATLVAAGVEAPAAAARYADLANQKPLVLASLMNLSAAMQRLVIGGQQTPLDFIHELIWDNTLAQDRFFAYADPAVLTMVRAAAAEGQFAEEPNPGSFHKGATCSYKQVQFDYSNVQLTFHERDTKVIDGITCIKMEPDMDLFKELTAHGLGEVVPNLSAHGLTNPVDVFALRWIDAVQSNEPLFDPGYTLSQAV